MSCKLTHSMRLRLKTDHREESVQALRNLELFEVRELHRLMRLALEAACFARVSGPQLEAAYHGLAAECAFELWWRDQRGGETLTSKASTASRSHAVVDTVGDLTAQPLQVPLDGSSLRSAQVELGKQMLNRSVSA